MLLVCNKLIKVKTSVKGFYKNEHSQLYYYDKYDSTFCIQCNDWETKCCGDSDCQFCNSRPIRPLELELIEF